MSGLTWPDLTQWAHLLNVQSYALILIATPLRGNQKYYQRSIIGPDLGDALRCIVTIVLLTMVNVTTCYALNGTEGTECSFRQMMNYFSAFFVVLGLLTLQKNMFDLLKTWPNNRVIVLIQGFILYGLVTGARELTPSLLRLPVTRPYKINPWIRPITHKYDMGMRRGAGALMCRY